MYNFNWLYIQQCGVEQKNWRECPRKIKNGFIVSEKKNSINFAENYIYIVMNDLEMHLECSERDQRTIYMEDWIWEIKNNNNWCPRSE